MAPEDEVYIHSGKYKFNRAIVKKLLPVMMDVKLLTGWKAGKAVRVDQRNAVVVEPQYRTKKIVETQTQEPRGSVRASCETEPSNTLEETSDADMTKLVERVKEETLEVQKMSKTLNARVEGLVSLIDRLQIARNTD